MNNIKSLRKFMKMTQIELANLCNVSQGSISGYEAGRIEPDNETLMRMADIFHVSIDVILGRDKAPPESAVPSAERPTITYNAQPDSKAPKTAEARILSAGIDKMPAKDRERALRMVRLMFDQYEEYFKEGTDDDDT